MTITSVLAAGSAATVGLVAGRAVELSTALVGAPPTTVLTLPPVGVPRTVADTTARLAGSDVLVVASGVARGVLDPELVTLLRRVRLHGVVAFALTVGEWPQEAAVVNTQLRPALVAAGATCLAPGLHVAPGQGGADRTVGVYAAYWAPVIGALVDLGRHAAAAAA